MGHTLTVRNISKRAFARFSEVARRNHRNPEAHVRFLIEREAEQDPLDTCGEILDYDSQRPAPDVKVAEIEAFQARRGRRSNRP